MSSHSGAEDGEHFCRVFLISFQILTVQITNWHYSYYFRSPIWEGVVLTVLVGEGCTCLLYTSPSPRDATLSRMPSSA